MDFKKNNEKIKEIKLNPRFCTNEVYETLINQGFSVDWMTEDEANQKSIFSLIIPEN